jgi:hypothetical protein
MQRCFGVLVVMAYNDASALQIDMGTETVADAEVKLGGVDASGISEPTSSIRRTTCRGSIERARGSSSSASSYRF